MDGVNWYTVPLPLAQISGTAGSVVLNELICSDNIRATTATGNYQYGYVGTFCWAEKLHGNQCIPDCEVDHKRIRWYEKSLEWPSFVPLKPWANGNNWTLEFMSYEQGRAAMQARSIGGFWFSEQFPWNIFLEVLRGCRDYMFHGGQFAEFTPIDPELCVAIEAVMDDPPPGWGFYRLNTEANRGNIAKDWYDQFFAAVPDEMLATRKTGALATFEGVIYQSFNPSVHITDDDSMAYRPGTTHHRAFDWGASTEHPMTGVWGCYDGMDDMLIYDEYWNTSQDRITQDHAMEILARSIAWGWPAPEFLTKPDRQRAAYAEQVMKLLEQMAVGQALVEPNDEIQYLDSFADPSRPGELNAFNHFGIATSPASNDVMKGIDLVRSRLKLNPKTLKPSLYIHRRCKHLIEELRKYRWLKKRPATMWSTAAPRPVPLKKDDDTVDSLRYLVASIARGRGLQPNSASARSGAAERNGMLLQRHGGGESARPQDAGKMGWFKK